MLLLLFSMLWTSIKKLIMINKMIMPIENAAIIDTDCKLYIDSSLKSSAIGSKINTIAQNVSDFLIRFYI